MIEKNFTKLLQLGLPSLPPYLPPLLTTIAVVNILLYDNLQTSTDKRLAQILIRKCFLSHALFVSYVNSWSVIEKPVEFYAVSLPG